MPCAELYPAELEFREATYLGRKGSGQGFIVWDAGIYRVVGPEEILISIATDELVSYRYTGDEDRVVFVDGAGCQFSYHRVP